tara:strand:- start:5361 stop:5483 length:123 start_codon:yes stop_codon:yes gene_type:complete
MEPEDGDAFFGLAAKTTANWRKAWRRSLVESEAEFIGVVN